MTWWGWWFTTAAGGASLMGLILAVVLGFVSWKISQATDKLIKSTSDGTQAIIERPHHEHPSDLGAQGPTGRRTTARKARGH